MDTKTKITALIETLRDNCDDWLAHRTVDTDLFVLTGDLLNTAMNLDLLVANMWPHIALSDDLAKQLQIDFD